MKSLKLLTTVLFFLAATYAMAQKPTSEVDSLKKRIEKLETELNSHESQISSAESKSNFAYGKAVEAEEMAFKTDRELWVIKLNWVSGIFAIVGLIIGFLGFRKFMENKAKERIEEYLKDQRWVDALNAKVQKRIAENKLKEEVNILVISNNDKSERIIKNYFQENKFNGKKIIYKRGTKVDFNLDFDILFINNMDNLYGFPDKSRSFPPSAAAQKTTGSASITSSSSPKVTKTPATTTVLDKVISEIKGMYANKQYAVFYFNDNGINLPISLNKDLNSSFTNSLASLYHNLLDLMRYKYVVLDNKKLE